MPPIRTYMDSMSTYRVAVIQAKQQTVTDSCCELLRHASIGSKDTSDTYTANGIVSQLLRGSMEDRYLSFQSVQVALQLLHTLLDRRVWNQIIVGHGTLSCR